MRGNGVTNIRVVKLGSSAVCVSSSRRLTPCQLTWLLSSPKTSPIVSSQSKIPCSTSRASMVAVMGLVIDPICHKSKWLTSTLPWYFLVPAKASSKIRPFCIITPPIAATSDWRCAFWMSFSQAEETLASVVLWRGGSGSVMACGLDSLLHAASPKKETLSNTVQSCLIICK